MFKLANNIRLVSPRTRFYLVIATTLLALLALLYLFLFQNNLSMTFVQSHAWLILVLTALTAMFSGWLQSRQPELKKGLFARTIGRGLIILAAGAALLSNLPTTLVVSCFVLGADSDEGDQDSELIVISVPGLM